MKTSLGEQSAPWKRADELHLHETTDASNGWLAEKLAMGSAVDVSKQLGLTRRNPDAIAPLFRELTVTGKA